MGKTRKSQGVRLEIRLGIAVIILVLTVLNFASYYTLYRIGNSLEEDIREKLAEASLLIAGHMQEEREILIDAEFQSRIEFDYSLENAEIFPLDFDRVIEISQKGMADSAMMAFDSSLEKYDISPILYSNPLYLRDIETQKYILLFPTERIGSKYVIAVSRRTDMISAITNAKRVLQIFSIIVGVVIILVIARLIKNVIRPFGILADEVRKANRGEVIESDDINEVIRSYERIISELKEKEAELRKLNELVTRKADHLEIYNNHVLRSIDTGIVTFDKNNRISTVNPAASRYLNIDQYEVVGQPYRKIFAGIPEISEGLHESIKEQSPIQYREIILTHEDRKKVLLFSIAALNDSNGENIGLVLILNDQTQFIEMQRELEHSRHLAVIGEMSGGLAHQLRNSIMAIVGFAKLISRKSSAEDPMYATANNLINEAHQAELLVARFLDYARPLHIAPDNFALSDFLEEITEASASRYPHITITYDCDEYSEPLFADHLLLKQALGNIVDNACQAYAGNCGTVTIQAHRRENSLIVTVSDSASGIPDDIHGQIFTPFFSGNPSGSGLGLPLAEKIIALHGGKISFESKSGFGTEFILEIPLTTAETSVESA